MAKRNQNEAMLEPDDELQGDKSLEQIQREIALLDLQTKQLNYAEAKQRNEKFIQSESSRRRHNQQRQSELAQGRAAAASIVKECRHKSGGSPTRILKGGGIGSFSIISRALMPDGVTVFLQCARCRLKEYWRQLNGREETRLQEGDPTLWAKYIEGKRLHDMSKDSGLEHAELRGPTFLFQNEQGVPIIPAMV